MMSAADPRDPPSEADGGAAPTPDAPSEEELRERLEEEVRNLRVQDVLLQSVVSIINLAARRIGKEDEQDLEQARVGIAAARAVVDLLDPEPADQVRNAISDIQVMYAGASGGSAPPSEAGSEPGPGTPGQPPPQPGSATPGQAEGDERGERKPPPGLWTPPGV